MFSKRDLENVIAICEQDEDAPAQAGRLKERCERALAYRDCEIHITEEDKRFLSQYYDEDMDPEAKETLDKVLGGGKSDVLGKGSGSRSWPSQKACTRWRSSVYLRTVKPCTDMSGTRHIEAKAGSGTGQKRRL